MLEIINILPVNTKLKLKEKKISPHLQVMLNSPCTKSIYSNRYMYERNSFQFNRSAENPVWCAIYKSKNLISVFIVSCTARQGEHLWSAL